MATLAVVVDAPLTRRIHRWRPPWAPGRPDNQEAI